MTNRIIRNAMFQNNLRMFEVAKILNISETTLYRRLREELPEDHQKQIAKDLYEWRKSHNE